MARVGVEGGIVLGDGVLGDRVVGAKFAGASIAVAGVGGGWCRGSQRVRNWGGRR